MSGDHKFNDPDKANEEGYNHFEAGRYEEALISYEKAAACGSTSAMTNMAHIFATQGDITNAIRWSQKAAFSGDLAGMTSTAKLSKSIGNVDDAKFWFREAAHLGDRASMAEYAYMMYQSGDIKSALYWYREAGLRGDKNSEDNFLTILKQYPDLASEIKASTTLENYSNFDAGHCPSADDETKLLIFRMAEGGNPNALRFLGAMSHETGNLSEAYSYMIKAAEMGDERALVLAGLIKQDEGNIDAARALFVKASDENRLAARAALDDLDQKILSDPSLAVIAIPPLGWNMIRNRDGYRAWLQHDMRLTESLLPFAMEWNDTQMSYTSVGRSNLQNSASSPYPNDPESGRKSEGKSITFYPCESVESHVDHKRCARLTGVRLEGQSAYLAAYWFIVGENVTWVVTLDVPDSLPSEWAEVNSLSSDETVGLERACESFSRVAEFKEQVTSVDLMMGVT